MNTQELKLITGGTGSGKTYKAFQLAKKIGTFAYLAPCRQLAVESFTFYGEDDDALSTGDVKIGDRSDSNNLFGVFETAFDVGFYDVVIIDEAHFMTEGDRGSNIRHIVKTSQDAGCSVFLLTATKNFRKPVAYQHIDLPPRMAAEKTEITFNEAKELRKQGVSTIEFVPNAAEAMISANTLPSERLRLQFAFQRGEIRSITCTNVLAQGLNFPCQNMILDASRWNTPELIKQKLGRLGRPGFVSDDCELTYSVPPSEKSTLKKKIKTKKAMKPQRRIHSEIFVRMKEDATDDQVYRANRYAVADARQRAEKGCKDAQRFIDIINGEEEAIRLLIAKHRKWIADGKKQPTQYEKIDNKFMQLTDEEQEQFDSCLRIKQGDIQPIFHEVSEIDHKKAPYAVGVAKSQFVAEKFLVDMVHEYDLPSEFEFNWKKSKNGQKINVIFGSDKQYKVEIYLSRGKPGLVRTATNDQECVDYGSIHLYKKSA